MGKELELAIKIGGKIDKSLGSAINAAQSQLNTINKGIDTFLARRELTVR